MSYGLEYPCGQLGSAASAVSPPSSLFTPGQLPVGAARETEKALTLCKHCSAIAKTSLCYLLSALFSINALFSRIFKIQRKLISKVRSSSHNKTETLTITHSYQCPIIYKSCYSTGGDKYQQINCSWLLRVKFKVELSSGRLRVYILLTHVQGLTTSCISMVPRNEIITNT